jgi:transposase
MLPAHVNAAFPQAGHSALTRVGCDEAGIRKGRHYSSVFRDLSGRRVPFAREGRDKAAWERSTRSLEAPNGQPKATREVSIDMSPAHIAGAREPVGPQAVVVFDKFHALAKVSAAVSATRRVERRLGAGEEAALPNLRARAAGTLRVLRVSFPGK